jgi:hypothetical protein
MKVIGVTVGTNMKPTALNPLPPITGNDEGKVLAVENGELVFKAPEETISAPLAEIDSLLGGE